MHSRCLVALPENAPLREEELGKFLWKHLNAYWSELEVEPYKTYFSQEQTVSLANRRGFPGVEALAQHLKESETEGVENGQYYWIITLNKNGRWDYFSIQKIATLKELKELFPELSPYSVVDKDGRWYSEQDYGYIPKLDYLQSQAHPDNVEPERQWDIFLQEFFGKHKENSVFVLLDVHS